MIRGALSHGSFARRIALRAIVVGGAVWVGGIVMRSLPHDQVLVFPVGSVFPNATRFSASWKTLAENEPSGGVSVDFTAPPPLELREHVSLPNGDYVVTIEVFVRREVAWKDAEKAHENPAKPAEIRTNETDSRGLETNIVRRVSLSGGETLVALAAGGF